MKRTVETVLSIDQSIQLVKRLDNMLEQVYELREFARENELDAVHSMCNHLSLALARFADERLKVSIVTS